MPFAQLLLMVTGGGAAVLLVALTGLVLRRGWQESRVNQSAVRGGAFRAALLPLIALNDDAALAALDRWRGDPVALDVSGHLLQLMRGGERDKLLTIVERLDLLKPDLVRLRSGRALQRIAAARRLGGFPSGRVGEALSRCFATDPQHPVRLEAGLALVRLQCLPGVQQSLLALDDGQFGSPAHRIILRALAAQRPAEMIEAWNATSDGAARFALADALGEVFDPKAFAALCTAVRDPDPQMRCEALRSMRRIGHPSVAGAVISALADAEWIVRVQAAATAGTMRLEGARPQLEALTRDAQWWVRYRATEALGNMALRARAAA